MGCLYDSIDKLFGICNLPKDSVYWVLGFLWLLIDRFFIFLWFLNGDRVHFSILQLFSQIIWQLPYIDDALVRSRYQLFVIICQAHSRSNLAWVTFDYRLPVICIKNCDCLGCAARNNDGSRWVQLGPYLEFLRVSWYVIPNVLKLRHLPHTQLPIMTSGHELSLLSYVHREYLTFGLQRAVLSENLRMISELQFF